MTEAMARQIMQLRMKGLGYKSIGIVVGTSRENVRYFCKTHGLDGYAEQVKMQYNERHNTPDNCKYCGKHIVRKPHSGKKLYCSDECRRRWWKEHPEAGNKSAGAYYNQVCAYCGRFFSSYGKKGRKYCCHNCYIMDRFWSGKREGGEIAKSSNRKTIKEIVLSI